MARRRRFRTVVLDPPWNETGGSGTPEGWGGGKRGADKHYPLLKTREMPEVIEGCPLWNIAPDAHCYLWVTKTFLPDGLWLMRELGFEYKTMLTWVKDDNRIGLGQYFRGRTEPLLFGVRGKGYNVRTPARNIDDLLLKASEATRAALDKWFDGLDLDALVAADALDDLILAARAAHSRKPPEGYLKVEVRSGGPFLEMFGRGSFGRERWTCWGNEAIAS